MKDNQRQATLAYFGGFFDGEGCITLYSTHSGPNKRLQYTGRVSLEQAHEEVIEEMAEVFGGSYKLRKKYKENLGTRKTYEWSITGLRLAEFLKLILPYLRVKKQEAEIAIKYCQTKDYTLRAQYLSELKEYRSRRD